MSAERRKLVEAVFIEAVAAPDEERLSLVEARCAGDEIAKTEVLSLLEYHAEEENDSGFLDHAELTGVGGFRRMEVEGPTLKTGTRVAGFTISSVLGSGGMGMVYLAEQDRPHRTVALKVIRLGAHGHLRRFEHEAEVLGRLQHPGIAQVYEAGTANLLSAGGPSAQPYIAMEFVQGLPLDKYGEQKGLDVRAKLDLVARVCDAVQHAHQRSVIHRDLKPANILVESASGEPKVLDFGVARATGADARDTMLTGAGQLIGTLSYMSPEQVLGDPAEVDTRTDVYALGVILYELLTGRLPHRLDGTALAESARIIREDEPARPGTVVRSLRGEVETIITKALAKDRNRRYQSAADLGLDLRRYLEGKPIAAKDDSAFYVLRKQLKRHRVMVGAAVIFVVLLAWFAVYASVQSSRNERSARNEARAKEQLKVELVTSTVERGRLLGLAGNLGAAEDLLWPAHLKDPGARQTRWALWELYSHQPCLATVQAHAGSVTGLLLSPDETEMYSAGHDGVIKVWDPKAAKPLSEFEGKRAGITSLAQTKDGSTLAAALMDGQVILWDRQTRKERLRIAAHKGAADDVAFSADGARLVTGGEDKVARIWDARTGALLAEMPPVFRTAAHKVAFSPDGAWIAAASVYGDGRVMLWDGGKEVMDVTRHPGGAGAVAFSPDGAILATSGWDRETRLWDIKERKTIGKLLSPNGYVQTLQFKDDGRTLLSTGWSTIDTWDVRTMKRTRAFSIRATGPSLAALRDGSRVVAGLIDGEIQFWDSSASPGRVRLSGHTGRVAGSISPNGLIAATGDQEGTIRLWDATSGELLATLRSHTARVKSFRFSPSGELLATGAEDAKANLWDLRTGKVVASLNRNNAATDDATNFSPDGKFLSVVRDHGEVTIHNVPDLSLAQSMKGSGVEVVGARFTPDGRSMGMITRERTVRVWPLDGGKPQELKGLGDPLPWCMAFAPDGKHMVIGDWSKDVQYWDTTTWKQVDTFHGHSALIAALEFNPADGTMVASSALEGVVRLWDVKTGLTLATLDAFDGWDSLSLSISRDGGRVMATGATGDAVIWNLSYFDRHIASNAEHQIRRLSQRNEDTYKADEVRSWAKSVLENAPTSPPAIGATPDVIKAWGASTPCK